MKLYVPVEIIWFSFVLQFVLLLTVILLDPYLRKEKRKLLLLVILLNGTLVLQNYMEYFFHDNNIVFARLLTAIYGYCARPLIITLFCHVLSGKRRHGIAWLLTGINAVVHLTALFSNICFTITPDNHFIRGPLGYTCHVISVILLAYLVWLSFSEYRALKKGLGFIMLVNSLMIAVAILMDGFTNYKYEFSSVTFLTVAIVICSIFYYIWLHLQYVKENEDDYMKAQRVKTMLSQMQPHFIYNSLTVISSYLDEPDKAEEALEHFTGFLRGNIDQLDVTDCISAEKEFQTVEHYLYLVKHRFGDKLTIKEDLRDQNFKLPAFTIQVLVENAVTHGIRKNKGGIGTLLLKSYETSSEHVVEVQDDGIGFEVTELEKDFSRKENETDGQLHVGLRNVKERIAVMCGGKMEIQSVKGEGTSVKVILPKER